MGGSGEAGGRERGGGECVRGEYGRGKGDTFCCETRSEPNWILVSLPHETTRPRTHSVFMSMQPRSSMLTGVRITGLSAPSRWSSPVKSLTLSLGFSHLQPPASAPQSSSFSSGAPGAHSRGVSPCCGASRNFMSDSPSSGFVFTQHWPGGSEPRSSTKSAGKASFSRTRTTSPALTSPHFAFRLVTLPSSWRVITSTTWLFVCRSATCRWKSSRPSR